MEIANNHRALRESLAASIIHECTSPFRGRVARLLGFSQLPSAFGAGQRAEVLCWEVRKEGRRVHFAAVTATLPTEPAKSIRCAREEAAESLMGGGVSGLRACFLSCREECEGSALK